MKFRDWQSTGLLISSGDMNMPFRILIHGAVLAVGVFVYSALAIGAFQQFFHVASVIWMLVLVGLGCFFRRRLWPEFLTVGAVIGVGLCVFFLGLYCLAATSSSNPGLADSLSGAMQLSLLYVPWFWLPFAVGAALGGIHRKQAKPKSGGQ
jgi:hypothetical protein